MITSHRITEVDWLILEEAILKDTQHTEKDDPVFFYEPGTCCNVWEYNGNPVLFCRGKIVEEKSVWLNIQFVDENDKRKNALVMKAVLENLVEKLSPLGFKDLQFKSDSSALVEFCKKKFGFIEKDGILHRILEA